MNLTSGFGPLYYIMLILCIFIVAFPLAYTINTLAPSGAYANTDLQNNNWMYTAVAAAKISSCNTSTITCLGCLNTNMSISNVSNVCWNPTGGVSTGVLLTLQTLCNACPSGCGPFRHQKNIYESVIDNFLTWNAAGQTFISIVSTLAFVVVVILLLTVSYFVLHAKGEAYQIVVQNMLNALQEERQEKKYIFKKYDLKEHDFLVTR